ncbi:PEP-CTERM sorting domain-containing protein [Pontiellaceae bacterium B1224]|nr:PEP-CTERM sorting domain-containing protein [Pontiellaceae bacterium B1224]
MKKTQSMLCLALVGGMLGSINAAVITSVTALDGEGSAFTTTTTANLNNLTNSVMQSFVADGTTYTTVPAAVSGASYVGAAEGIMYHPGATVPALSTALTDLDLGTACLDLRGDNYTPGDHFRFDAAAFTTATTFFLFNNGTPASGVYLVDTDGNAITDTVGTDAEVQIGGWDYERTNGGNLSNRDVAGVTFAVGDFTFTGGNTIADMVGFQISGGNTADINDAGIAVAIPEPATLGLLVGSAGGLVLIRRRFLI